MTARLEDQPLVVALGDRTYPIHIVAGPVADAERHAAFWSEVLAPLEASAFALVTNVTLEGRLGHPLVRVLEAMDKRVVRVVLPDGEAYKTAASIDGVHDAMLEARLDRRAVVIALGGGVVGDLAGFAAATYQRGVRFVQVPTTLLAQVDSSVGGKTGINHRRGKNMIGAFHQPVAVVSDVSTLATLPAREFASGMAEVVKYGAALDLAFFEWLEAHADALRMRDAATIAQAIRHSCEIKAQVVASDEFESGDRRALLNFGHTFGHAIEGATGYGTWLHGEAVAAGMVMASRLSVRLGGADEAFVERLGALLARFDLPIAPPDLPVEAWLGWMSGDKKAERGRMRFVLLDGPGRSRVAAVPDDVLRATLHDTPRELAMRGA